MSPSVSDGEVLQNLRWFRRNNPSIQILLSAACIAFNPGFYLALALLGAGGGQPSSAQMGNIASGTLYGVFAFSAVAAGSFLNIVGPRVTLIIACTGYPIFNGAMWYFSLTGHMWFPIFAGAYLGITAGCLWTTSVFMSIAYPEEKDRGFWRAIQWLGNLAGSTIGSAVALGVSWNRELDGVPASLYITFIVLQILSIGFALLVLPPDRLRRSDGTALARFDPISTLDTVKTMFTLIKDWRILLLIPCMFVPEMLFPFQSTMNAYAFNLRTRTLNSFLNSIVQIPLTYLVGWMLDYEGFGNRKRRLYVTITFVGFWLTAAYVAQTIWLASWKFDLSVTGPGIDCTDPAYAGAVVIYMVYAAQYGGFTNLVVYTLSTFSNEPRKAAGTGGLVIGFICAGTATSFGLNASGVPFQNINAGLFALTTISWPILYYVTYKGVPDTMYGKEEAVIVPMHVRKELGLDKMSEDDSKTGPVDVYPTANEVPISKPTVAEA